MQRCSCGRRMSKYANECRQCARERIERNHAEARAVVAAGVCPRCGAGLRRNSALTGWWQCEQYGATGFRANPDAPACSFQCFTD